MKRRRWFVCLATALLLVWGIQAAGAAGSTEGTTATPARGAPAPVKFMMTGTNQAMNNPDLKIWQWLNEAGNIKIEPMLIPSDAYAQKLNVVIASGDIPDLIQMQGTYGIVQELGPQGFFVPISDNYAKVPNLYKFISEHPQDARILTLTDGKVYILPWTQEVYRSWLCYAIRGDLLRKGGFDPASIKTPEDLYKAFLVLKEQNGGKPVYGMRNGLTRVSYLLRTFGTNVDTFPYYDYDQKKYIDQFALDRTKEGVQFMVNMYKDGLLHKDYLTMQDRDWETNVNTGMLTFFTENMENIVSRDEYMRKNTDPNTDWVLIKPPLYNGKQFLWERSNFFSNYHFHVISSKSKATDGILAAMNWLYDLNNWEKIQYGEEGVTFGRAADKTPVRLDWYDVGADGKVTQRTEVNAQAQKLINEVYGTSFNLSFVKVQVNAARITLGGAAGMGKFGAGIKLYDSLNAYVQPPLAFTADETETLKTTRTPLVTFIQESIAGFINGTKPMAEWGAFTAQVKKMNGDRVVDLYNTVAARAK